MRHNSSAATGVNPAMLPSKQYLMNRLGQIGEIDPKSIFQRHGGVGSSRNRQQQYLANEPRDETVEAKWEHLQYYEQRLQES